MRINPVYNREITVSSRSFRVPLVIMIFNGILAVVALLSMYSTVSQIKVTAEIQYSSFLNLYVFVATLEFLLLLFIMPAMTAGSISGERERQTLELMMTTLMKPVQIVTGKLAAALGNLFLIILSSFPVMALVFIYGGVTALNIAVLLGFYLTVALFSGTIGIFCSSVCRRSTTATVMAYMAILIIALGTYGCNYIAYTISSTRLSSYANVVGNTSQIVGSASSGACIYLMLFNPIATFLSAIGGQTGNIQQNLDTLQMFGTQPSNLIFRHWVMYSMILQWALTILLFLLSVRAVDPENRKKNRR